MSHPKRMLWIVFAILVCSCTAYAQDQSSTPTAQVDDFATDLITTKSPEQREALLVTKKDLLTPDLRKSIIRQGNVSMMSGMYARAFDIYNLAQVVAGRIDDKEGLAAASLNIGTIYYFQGDFAQALEHYKTSRRLSLEVQNKYEAAKALSGIALIQKEQQDNVEALQSFDLALKEFTELGDQDEVAKALNSIAAIYYSQGDYTAATKALLRSSEIKPDSENKLRTADAFYMQGDYEKASTHYLAALKDFEADRDAAGMIGSLTGAANSAYYTGSYDEALDFFRRNIAVQDRFGDESGIATSYQGMGNVFRALGDLGNALDSYLKSLERADRSQVKISTATTFGSIGLVRSLQGANLEAIAYFRKSLQQFEENGDKVGMARMLSHIGNAQYAQGEYSASLESYAKALALRESMNDQINKAHLLIGIGTVHFTTEDYQSALDSYTKALRIFESAANREAVADVLTRLADVYLRKDDAVQSLVHAERAAALAKQIDSLDTLWFARHVAGKAQLKLNQTASAIQSFTEAVAIVETLRARPISGEAGPERSTSLPHLALVDLYMTQNKPAEAFGYLEQAKIQSLISLLKRGRALSLRGLSTSERDQERKLIREISSVETQINREAESRHSTEARRTALVERRRQSFITYAQFRKSIQIAHPGLRVDRGELTLAKPEDLQKVVTDKHSAFLEYVITENNIYLFVATTNDSTKAGSRKAGSAAITFKAYPIDIQSAHLIQQVIGFSRSLAARDQSFATGARLLFDELLKPAADQLAGKTNLIVAPDGFLWRVPFEALQPEADRYLIDQASVSYVHSLASLKEMRLRTRLRRAGSPGLVAFVSPQLSEGQRRRIDRNQQSDASIDQVNAIQRLGTVYGESQTRVLTGNDANEERVNTDITRASILHFATPTILDDTSPMFSFTALTPGANHQGDGMLLSREIVNLQTLARLVVVSNGVMRNDHIANGEALTGLAWSWFVAGSPTTLVNRWNIQSPSVAQMAYDLHAKLKPTTPNRIANATALQRAALNLRNSTEFSHPYYWANFALIGDGR